MSEKFESYEDKPRRRQQSITIGKRLFRTYLLPSDSVDTLLPAKGYIPIGDTNSTDSRLSPRLKEFSFGQQKGGAFQEVTAEYIQPEGYTA